MNLTDNEIIKAYEEIIQSKAGHIWQDVLDLLNRQKAEIERLRKGFTADMDYFASEYDNKIKFEAIKEFAERVQRIITIKGRQKDYFDEIVKEMVGGG